MSLKSIEMQIAIPRTNEAAKLQSQLHQKPAEDQAAIAGQTVKRTEESRWKSAEIEESANLHVREEGTGSQGGGRETSSGGSAGKEEAKPAPSKHPYKGKHIDFSL